MTSERFALDANVLVYGADATEPRRQERSRRVMVAAAATGRCILSVQAIGEFFVTVRRRRLMPETELAKIAADYLRLFSAVAVQPADVMAALPEAASARLSYWDALLLATVGRSGCGVLLSEDMQDGWSFAGVTVIDPFKGDDLPQRVAELLAA